MNIGSYTFQEFKRLAENFHAMRRRACLSAATWWKWRRPVSRGDVVRGRGETRKCLPDAVQLLTLCSAGNNWMKVHNLGRYAVSLFDKHTGEACV